MLPPERHKLILLELESHGNVSVAGLVDRLHVSIDTVRRDLKYLERQGEIRRIHGGAIKKEEALTNQAFQKRRVAYQERKAEIAKHAAGYVQEHQAVSLNAGTTNIEMAKELAARFEHLTVITNSLNVAKILAAKKNFTIIVTGGTLNHDEESLYGGSISDEIEQFNIDLAFISINAISLQKGLTDFRQGEREVISSMISSADKAIVIADSSKFETVSYLKVCELGAIHLFVTDRFLEQQLYENYEQAGVQIVRAGP